MVQPLPNWENRKAGFLAGPAPPPAEPGVLTELLAAPFVRGPHLPSGPLDAQPILAGHGARHRLVHRAPAHFRSSYRPGAHLRVVLTRAFPHHRTRDFHLQSA